MEEIKINKLYLTVNNSLNNKLDNQLKEYKIYRFDDYIYNSNILNFILCKDLKENIYISLFDKEFKYIKCIDNKNIIEWNNKKDKYKYYCKFEFNQNTYILYYDNQLDNFILNLDKLNINKKNIN